MQGQTRPFLSFNAKTNENWVFGLSTMKHLNKGSGDRSAVNSFCQITPFCLLRLSSWLWPKWKQICKVAMVLAQVETSSSTRPFDSFWNFEVDVCLPWKRRNFFLFGAFEVQCRIRQSVFEIFKLSWNVGTMLKHRLCYLISKSKRRFP